MRIFNNVDFISLLDIIFKRPFKLVIPVKILVVVLTIKVFATVWLTFSWVMSFLKVLISASVSEFILLGVIIVSLGVIFIETSLWIRIIIFTPLIWILIPLIVVLMLSYRRFVLMCRRAFTIPKKFFLSENLLLNVLILRLY